MVTICPPSVRMICPILSRSNDPVPVETRLQIVLAVMSGEITVAEAARRHGVSTESINRLCR
jgi:transposase-like protein